MRLAICGRLKYCVRTLKPQLESLGHIVVCYATGFVPTTRFDDAAFLAKYKLQSLMESVTPFADQDMVTDMLRTGKLDGIVTVSMGSPIDHPNIYDSAERLRVFCKQKAVRGGVYIGSPSNSIVWFDGGKRVLNYLEVNLIDDCNLNCAMCTHFAPLFPRHSVYDVEQFRHDMARLSELFIVNRFRLLGGEPLLLPNLFEYLQIARESLPHTNMNVVTNGLLIPGLPDSLLDYMCEAAIAFDISVYKPTAKVLERISVKLSRHNVLYTLGTEIKEFRSMLTRTRTHDSNRARAVCENDHCRFLRDGVIYKCPPDGTAYRYNEYFDMAAFPTPSGVNIYDKDAPEQIVALDGNIELCHYCSEHPQMSPWRVITTPKPSDWLIE